MRYSLPHESTVQTRTRPANISANASNPHAVRAAVRKAALLPFVFVMYAYATGGPFGLEDMVSTSGPGLALLYILFIPLFWCIPVSLVAAELTTAIPVEGGFYRWVRSAFGDFWGFQAGWWNWSASFLLAAAYAVLTTDYLSFFFPAIVGWKHYLVSLLIIAVIAWINVRGIQMVGAVSTVLELFVLLVVAALFVIAATKWQHNPFTPLVPPHVPSFQVFGAGLALGLWLYSGYEQVSSVAEEVENPQRNYPIALAIVVPLSMATYFLPTMFSLAALGDWQKWHTGYFSGAAALIGGPWLGFGIAIVVSSIIYALLAQKTMVQLLTVYVWLRIGVTVLTVLASWRLRETQPDLTRPFRIPWGRAGLLYVIIAPLAMSVVALVASDPFARKWGPVPVLLGPAMYFVLRKLRAEKINAGPQTT